MARQKGSANFSGTIEPLAGGALDARDIVQLKTDLTAANSFPYPYIGMETYVVEEDKKYRLIGADPTVLANWKEVGSGSGQTIQVDELPTASADELGKVYQYIGETDTDYTHGFFYECVEGETAGTYEWVQTDTQPETEVMPASDMPEIVTPLPSVMSRRFKYSTEEQVIGEWIDGKPVYQKTVDCGALPNATTKTVAHGISNVDYIINYFGVAYNPNNTNYMTLPKVALNNLNGGVDVGVNSSQITITSGVDRSPYSKTYITIQYTKTTD